MSVSIQKSSKQLNRYGSFFCGNSHDPREGLWTSNLKSFVKNGYVYYFKIAPIGTEKSTKLFVYCRA